MITISTLLRTQLLMTRTFAARMVTSGFLALVMLFAINTGPAPDILSGPTKVIAAEAVPGGALGSESDSDIWRRVRQGNAFTLSSRNLGSPVLVQSNGEEWRAVRNGPVSTYGGYLILFGLVATALFFAVRGRIRIANGRTGRMVPRFSMVERIIHWYVAVLFVVLALTGLSTMFGKFVLLPLIGQAAFAAIAGVSLQIHDLLGLPFVLGVIAMFARYLKDNIAKAVDFIWLIKGGIFGKSHVSSWKYNFGEKIWFWLAIIAGVALSSSGLLLVIPPMAPDLATLQLASLIHAISAVIVISVSIGHIYLGTIGVEGAFEGMWGGMVDENWALEHHDLWADEVMSGEGDATGVAEQEAVPAE